MMRGYARKDLADHGRPAWSRGSRCSDISRSGATRRSPPWPCSGRWARCSTWSATTARRRSSISWSASSRWSSTSPAMLRVAPGRSPGSRRSRSSRRSARWVAGDAGGHLGGGHRRGRSGARGQLARRAHVHARDDAGARVDALSRCVRSSGRRALRWALYAGMLDPRRLHRVLRAVRGARPGDRGCGALLGAHGARSVARSSRGSGSRTVVSLAPWVVVARAQLSHTARAASGCPSSASSASPAALVQFFIGPPINTWVHRVSGRCGSSRRERRRRCPRFSAP